MHYIPFVLFTLIIFTNSLKAQTSNEEALIELERHIELGNLSKSISNKLREYFINGGELDDSDWLYFIQSGLADIEENSISELIEKRNKKISVSSGEIIQILREAGFLIDSDLSKNKKYEILNKELVEISANIALLDTSKAMLKDIESDVLKGNNAYIYFLQELSQLSDNNFNPTEINEEWQTEKGPITVQFRFNRKNFVFIPEYFDDWLDGSMIEKINAELHNSNCGFYTLKSDYITGQESLIIFLYDQEKEILMNKLHWQLDKL